MKSESGVRPVSDGAFDLVDEDRPRDRGFVSIGEIAKPMVERLAQHLADKGVIAPPVRKAS